MASGSGELRPPLAAAEQSARVLHFNRQYGGRTAIDLLHVVNVKRGRPMF